MGQASQGKRRTPRRGIYSTDCALSFLSCYQVLRITDVSDTTLTCVYAIWLVRRKSMAFLPQSLCSASQRSAVAV